MTKNSKLVNIITLVGVLIALVVFYIQRFYVIGTRISEVPKSFELITGFTIHVMAALVVLVHIFTNGKFNKKFLILMVLFEFFLALSFQNAGWVNGRFAILGIPLMFLFLIGIFPRYKVTTPALIIKIFYSFFAVIPVILYLFAPDFKEIIETAGEFNLKGFESSRTTYSLITGLAFTSHLIDRKRGWLVFVCLFCIGMFYAQSRASVATCAIVLIYIVYTDDRIRNKRILFLIVGITIPLFVVLFINSGTRSVSGMFEWGDRLILYTHHLGYIKDHFLLGSGGFYTPKELELTGLIKPGAPAHNLLLETLSSFGIIVTITWIILLSYFWKILHKMGRTYILFIAVFGTFHNGFGLSVLNANYFFILVLAVLTSNSFRSGLIPRGKRYRKKRQKVPIPVQPPELNKQGFAE